MTEQLSRNGAGRPHMTLPSLRPKIAVRSWFVATSLQRCQGPWNNRRGRRHDHPPWKIEAQILRYYHAEHWRIGTIAKQLRVHRDTVTRVLKHELDLPGPEKLPRPSKIEPYLPFILETWRELPRAQGRAACTQWCRSAAIAADKAGSAISLLRHRPRPPAEAVFASAHPAWRTGSNRLGALLGHLVIVAGYSPSADGLCRGPELLHARSSGALLSRCPHGELPTRPSWRLPRPGMRCQESFCTTICRSAVLERRGDAIRASIPPCSTSPAITGTVSRALSPSRGATKVAASRKKRALRAGWLLCRAPVLPMSTSSMPRPTLGAMARRRDRRCPRSARRHGARSLRRGGAPPSEVAETNPYPVVEQVTVWVGKTPYVRFDQNDCSLPHSHVRRSLTVLADPDRVRIVHGQQILASHRRSYDKGAQIEDAAHVEALVAMKREGPPLSRYRSAPALVAPASQTLLARAARAWGHNLGTMTATLMRLLQRYGEPGAAGLPSWRRSFAICRYPSAVRLVLERRRRKTVDKVPPVAMTLLGPRPSPRCGRAAAFPRGPMTR